jgi:hypothetical protein
MGNDLQGPASRHSAAGADTPRPEAHHAAAYSHPSASKGVGHSIVRALND